MDYIFFKKVLNIIIMSFYVLHVLDFSDNLLGSPALYVYLLKHVISTISIFGGVNSSTITYCKCLHIVLFTYLGLDHVIIVL